MKEKLRTYIDSICGELCGLADDIFDHPECGGEERYAVERLTKFLRDQDFTVETGIAGLPTAFRAIYQRPPCAAVWGRIPRRRSWCTGLRRRRRPWGRPLCCGKGISVISISR